MSNTSRVYDSSGELLVYRYLNGIKLIRPDAALDRAPMRSATGHSVSSLLELPCNVYFLDTESVSINMNESNAGSIFCSSVNAALGKSIFDVASRRTANVIRSNDLDVITHKKVKIVEEYALIKEEIDINALTIKLPWYANDSGKIIGVFGFSILLGTHSLAKALQSITELNLLNTASFENSPSKPRLPVKINNIILTKRETDILPHLIRSKSSRAIAQIMQLSPRTIEQYINNLKNKLGVKSKVELIEILIDHLSLKQ